MQKENQLTKNMLEKFEKHLYDGEKSRATVEKYLRDVKDFCIFLGKRSLCREHVVAYKTHLADSYKISSANSMLAALNSFFRFLKRDELCVRQFRLQRRVYCEENRELSRDEYARLIRAAEEKSNARLSLIIQTICSTGIRVSELRCITVEAIKRGEATVSCKGKSRLVFITVALRRKLTAYIKKNKLRTGAVFVTKNGRPLDRSNIWREMKALCKNAGVAPEKVFPHNLRHLFARTFYGIEKDIVKLADILGHSNVNTTRIYTVTGSKEHRRRMENMHLIL